MAWLEQARARSSRSTSGTATACQRRSHRSMSWMSNLLAPALLAGCSGVHTIPAGSVAWAERHEQGERVGPGKSTTRAQTDRCRTQCADEHVLSVPTCAAIAESTLPTRSPSTRRARPPSSHRESAVTTGSSPDTEDRQSQSSTRRQRRQRRSSSAWNARHASTRRSSPSSAPSTSSSVVTRRRRVPLSSSKRVVVLSPEHFRCHRRLSPGLSRQPCNGWIGAVGTVLSLCDGLLTMVRSTPCEETRTG